MRIVLVAAPLIATLLGACGSQPDLTVSVGSQRLPIVLASASKITGWWSGETGDAFPMDMPLSTLRAAAPVTLQFDAGQGASDINVWLYDKDTPSSGGGPTEEFVVHGRTGTYAPRTISVGHTYEILVNVKWSGLLVHGEVTYVFRLKLETCSQRQPSPPAAGLEPATGGSSAAVDCETIRRVRLIGSLRLDECQGAARLARSGGLRVRWAGLTTLFMPSTLGVPALRARARHALASISRSRSATNSASVIVRAMWSMTGV